MKFHFEFSWKSKLCLMTLLGFLSFGISQAQTQKISGTISADGTPLPGVSIVVKGTNVGAIADFDGNYSIQASSSDILVFSYVGYTTKELKVGNNTTLNVRLAEDVAALEEVIVYGYGSVKRKDLTGSVVSIKAEDMQKVKTVSFEGALAAKAAGVQVVTSQGGPDAGFRVLVRGGTSVNASTDPLYVVDGFALEGNSRSTALGLGNSNTSPLSTIDPANIESIEVLKDASATALYGSRGANGVVIITTKKGRKGRTDMDFNMYTSVSTLANRIDLMTAQEFVDYRLEYTPWDENNPTDQFVGAYRDGFGNPIDLNDSRVILTDWQDEIMRTAITKNYNFGIRGGSENSSYSASISYLDKEGIVKNTDFERYNINLNVTQNLGKKVKAGVTSNISISNRSGIVSAAGSDSNGQSGIVTSALLFSPVQGLTRYDDAEYDENGLLLTLRSGDITNPVRRLEGDTNTGNTLGYTGSAYLSYEIAKNLTFRTSISGNYNKTKNKSYFNENFGWGKSANGRAFVGQSEFAGLTTTQNFTYNNNWNKHSLNVVAVYEQQEGYFEQLTSSATGFNLPGFNVDLLQSATETLNNRTLRSESSIRSAISRIQYDFDDRFVFNASARWDESSKFAPGEKWGFFPSAGFAWKASNENFLKDQKTISNLKFKVSYGETGNANIPSYQSFGFGELANYFYDGNLATGVSVNRIPNPALTWETTTQLDAGFNLGLFNNRVNFEFDYYNKQTSDLLLRTPIPNSTGFDIIFKNTGSLENKGYEFALSTVNVDTENFSWNTSFNISFNKNKILDLGGADQFLIRAIGNNQVNNDYIVRVGESLGTYYGIEQDGVYNYSDFVEFDGLSNTEAAAKLRQDSADSGDAYFDIFYTLKDGVVKTGGVNNYRPGLPKFKDQLTVDTNGDGIPDEADGTANDEDQVILGRSAPKHFGGFTNNFRYKNFDLGIVTQWVYGNDIYNKNRVRGNSLAVPYSNKYAVAADRWTPENYDSDIPGIWGYGDGGFGSAAKSVYVEDGSYFRISNITIGYTIPSDVVDKIGIKKVRLYGSVDNVFLFTNYTGFDPDVNVGNNQLTPGLDSDAYPRERTFNLGLNVGF
ncbi:TonB-dependent receptor [uncultured Maribacter sp.]|uniref:SusC/RagA family TonB-linked outer membrane protein n=1 Tax=uncultured Maribacter sp. TaxID=431308 RepID=UPI0026321371|nr:TonB-dependent receptor [uncultured Maribacter sp.]